MYGGTAATPGYSGAAPQASSPFAAGMAFRPVRVEKKTRTAKWATVTLSIILSMFLVGYITTGAAMGNTGTDANGNSVGVIFWLELWQIPIILVIVFGFSIAVALLDIRSRRKSNDLAKAERAVDTAFYASGNLILMYGISAAILFVTSIISLAWRATLIFSCTGTGCFIGIYLQAIWVFFILDIFTAIAAAIAIGFGFYFWYQVKTREPAPLPPASASAAAAYQQLGDGTHLQRPSYGGMRRQSASSSAAPLLPLYVG